MAKHAILFDLDGTLVDTIELIMKSMEFTFRDFDGPRPTRDVWLEGLGITLRTQLAAWARTPAELDWLIARYRVFQSEHHDAMTAPYPGVTEVLDELRAAGHPMALVTSKLHALATRVLRHVEFVSHFDTVVGGDSIENPKPHPEPVFRALTDLKRPAHQAIFVGDSPHDIRAGNAAGVATAAALWGPFSREQLTPAQPTYWVGSIHELPPLIAAL
jgi:pyrophosphatase PpaX